MPKSDQLRGGKSCCIDTFHYQFLLTIKPPIKCFGSAPASLGTDPGDRRLLQQNLPFADKAVRGLRHVQAHRPAPLDPRACRRQQRPRRKCVRTACDDLGPLAQRASIEPDALAATVFQKVTSNSYGIYDGLIISLDAALGRQGRATLRGLLLQQRQQYLTQDKLPRLLPAVMILR